MPLRLRSVVSLAGLLAVLLSAGCIRKQFFQPDARADASSPLPPTADSVRNATAGRQYARHGRLYEALVGRHHRASWAAPVAAPVLRLAQVGPGGVRPGKIGGGFNSTSLTLNAADNQAYVVRTVDKDPVRAMPEWLRGTFLVNVLRDNISSTNPYAALVVPPLAQAVGVAHSSPHLFYVRADDPAFQSDSLRHFKGQLALLEEKAAPPGGPVGDQTKILNSKAAFKSVFESPQARLDQPALLRARLLDGWLGDWDRHPGQWNWAASPPNAAGYSAITPLPKDRDMVFYRLDDGVLGWVISTFVLPHWATFGPRYKKPTRLLGSGEYVDERGLNALSKTEFRAAAVAMQQRLPDTLLTRAVRALPPAVLALEGPRLIAALQARREALPQLAETLYRKLAKRPIVGGTGQAERFDIHRYRDSTIVAVYATQPAPGTPATPVYRRAFFAPETRVIQLEGLAGDDVFSIEEHAPGASHRPRIRIYGGPGTDELRSTQLGAGIQFVQGSAPEKAAYDRLPEE